MNIEDKELIELNIENLCSVYLGYLSSFIYNSSGNSQTKKEIDNEFSLLEKDIKRRKYYYEGDMKSLEERIEFLKEESDDKKVAFLETIFEVYKEEKPEKSYWELLNHYTYLTNLQNEKSEVSLLIRTKALPFFEKSSNNFLNESNYGIVFSKEEIEKIKLKTIIIYSPGTLQKEIEKLDIVRHKVHTDLLEHAKKLNKSYLDVHVDTISNKNKLSNNSDLYLNNDFTESHRNSYNIFIKNSGEGKIALMIGFLGIHINHDAETQGYHIIPKTEGYRNLGVRGETDNYSKSVLREFKASIHHFWKSMKEMPKNDYDKNIKKPVYYSVAAKDMEFDAKAMDKINEVFREVISFSGFAPSFMNHEKWLYHRVIEFDYNKIAELSPNPDRYLANVLERSAEILGIKIRI